jgi:hypothetical protein
MEAMGETPDGRQYYVLTQDDNDAWCRIRTVTVVMMQPFSDIDDMSPNTARSSHNRPARIRYFVDIGAKMDRVLNWIRGA